MAESGPPIPAEIAAQSLETLEGAVERLTFSDPETHYAVVRLKVRGARHPVTVVGPLAGVQEGEQLHLKGKYEVHPKWGEQFKVVWWFAVLPATVAGIEKYLASGLVKGIGPEMAKRLVARFGAETLEIIDSHPERLKEVPGFGPKRLEQIRKDWQGRKEMRDVVVALQGLGLGLAHAGKIFQRYGAQALEVITTNPYQLALDIQGLGFFTADRLAGRLNLDPLTPARLAAGLLHVLDTFASDGHVYVPEEELLDRTQELLQVDRKPLVRALELQARKAGYPCRRWTMAYAGFTSGPPGWRKTGWPNPWGAWPPPRDPPAPAPGRSDLPGASRQGLELSEDQALAVGAALKESSWSSPAGRDRQDHHHQLHPGPVPGSWGRVLLMAPTGRAAKRLNETTGAAATTIHRPWSFPPRPAVSNVIPPNPSRPRWWWWTRPPWWTST